MSEVFLDVKDASFSWSPYHAASDLASWYCSIIFLMDKMHPTQM